MKFYKFLLIVLIVSLSILVSCQKNDDLELPGIDLTLHDMDNGIKIIVPELMNSNGHSPFIYTEINNNSDKEFQLNKQNGIYIFEYKKKQWVPVNNLMDYGYSVEAIIYPMNSGLPSKDTIVIVPDVTNEEENILLLVVYIGEYISPDGSTNQQAGAYRDFWLTPNRTVLTIDEESP